LPKQRGSDGFFGKRAPAFKNVLFEKALAVKKDSRKLKRILTSGIRVFAGVCWFSNSSSTAGAVK
jgi:hypothetical protein